MAFVTTSIALLIADSLISSAKPKTYILDTTQKNLPYGARAPTDCHAERVGYCSNKNNDKYYVFLRYRPGAETDVEKCQRATGNRAISFTSCADGAGRPHGLGWSEKDRYYYPGLQM